MTHCCSIKGVNRHKNFPGAACYVKTSDLPNGSSGKNPDFFIISFMFLCSLPAGLSIYRSDRPIGQWFFRLR